MIPARLVRLLGAVGFLVWITFVLAAYYIVQKPVMPSDPSAVADWLVGFEGAPAFAGIAASLLNLLTAPQPAPVILLESRGRRMRASC